jgi:hypothetical protein
VQGNGRDHLAVFSSHLDTPSRVGEVIAHLNHPRNPDRRRQLQRLGDRKALTVPVGVVRDVEMTVAVWHRNRQRFW